MDADLKAAAEAGDITMLYTQIEKDPHVLEKIDKMPFVHTPLHIAAAAGHARFATEIIRLMPSFAHKLNQQGLNPQHLAIQNVDMVLRFLSISKDIVRLKGREGLTPLHFAAESGNDAILRVFLSSCPDSIEDITDEGETALHFALKKRNFDALRFLVEWLQKYRSSRSCSHIPNSDADSRIRVSDSSMIQESNTEKF